MYNRQSGPGSAGPPGAMQQPSGPNAGNSKPQSEYPSAYGGGYGEFRHAFALQTLPNPKASADLVLHPDIIKCWNDSSSSNSSQDL